MKKIISIVLGIFIIAGVVIFYFASSKKNTEPEYMPCPVLEEGETMDVEIPSFLYRSTASSMVSYAKNEGRCVDAWVNDDGEFVVRLDQETLEKEYSIYYNDLMKEVSCDDITSKLRVSYDYSVLTMYVNDTTPFDDFRTFWIWVPGNCYMLQLLQGIPSDDVSLDIVVIYEPTGKEILRIKEDTKMIINQEDWAKLLESGKN